MKKNKKDGIRFFKIFDEISIDSENVKYYDIKKTLKVKMIFLG